MKTLFTITLVVELLAAIGYIAAPRSLFATLGVTLNEFGISLARLFGSALLAFVVMLWYGRSTESTDAHRAVLATMFTYWLVSSIFFLIIQLSGLVNVMGWGTVILHLIFLVAYGIFLLRR